MMDPDIEFNALSALYQSVAHDMKQTYPAWEAVSQRATKLSQQLRVTVQCLASFVDSLQTVSDLANNLKGSTRDVGACVTRVCMRERALESRLRAVADSLQDQLAQGIQQRTSYWRQRTNELDKTVSKHVKKVRSQKGRPDIAALNEQKGLCRRLLNEQRAQFSFFISTLMPFLHAEVGALEEGAHIHQVVDTLDETMKCVDADVLVEQIIADVSQGADNAWKQCLASASKKFDHDASSMNMSLDGRSATPCMYDDDVTPQERPHTISSATSSVRGFPTLSSHTFVPPSKPPLQRRPSERSTLSITPSEPCSSVNFRNTHEISHRIQRPQSFSGELRNAYQPPYSVPGASTFFAGGSSCSSSDASAALLAETLQQIDQLGSDLENYCLAATSVSTPSVKSHEDMAHSAPSTHLSNGSYTNNVKIRAAAGSSSRPPPPTRRSSTITAATPNAPSVVEARLSSAASNMGSRQSLLTGSTGDLHFISNVNPYNRQSSVGPHFKL